MIVSSMIILTNITKDTPSIRSNLNFWPYEIFRVVSPDFERGMSRVSSPEGKLPFFMEVSIFYTNKILPRIFMIEIV